jgi:hypothetical protein
MTITRYTRRLQRATTSKEQYADLGYSDFDVCDMLVRVFFPGTPDNDHKALVEGLYAVSRRAHGVRAPWKFKET